MTNTHDPLPQGRQEPYVSNSLTPVRYKLTWEQALQDFRDGLLTPRGLIYYSVATRGKRLKVKVDEYCKDLGLHRATYYRAIGALEARKRLYADAPDGMILSMPDLENEDQEAESFTVSGESQLSDNPSQLSDNPSQLSDNPSQLSDNPSQLSDNPKMKPALGASFKNAQCTNRSIKNLKDPIGTSTVAAEQLNSGGLGTKENLANPHGAEIKGFLMLATQASIQTNGAIAKTLMTLRSQRSAAESLKAVENSISAIVEMMERGIARNPGALLNASLQREINGQGFTANGAKIKARERSPLRSETLPGEPPSPLPADMGDTIALITCELERLDWSKDQAIAHMMKQHHWRRRTFSQLTDADLIKLLSELQGVHR